MTDFYSRNDVNYNGDVYSIPFPYIKEKEVQVFLDDTLFEDWFFLNDSQIKLRNIPQEVTSNTIVSVRRITDIDKKVVTYTNNTLLNKENLNLSQDQLLFAVQEIYDNNAQFQSDIREEVDEKVERVSDAVEKLEFLEDSVAIANEAALVATEQAQIATEKAEETLQTYETAMNDIDNLLADCIDDLNSLDATIKKDADAIINRVGLNMFDTVLKDHILTYEESKGLALQGTYVYKNAIVGSRYGYADFYNKVVEEYNEATSTETVNGVTVKVHSNGHKFYDIANKSAIDTFFNTMGSAWMYGIDTENERIFLPRNNWFEQMTGNVEEVGQSIEAGLPSISHTHTRGTMEITGNVYGLEQGGADGAFDASDWQQLGNNGADCNLRRAYFQASRTWTGATSTNSAVSSIYGKSNTVQPNAVKKLLYICVGNTVSDTSWVDVVTQVQGGVKDLEDKTNEGIERLKASSTALTQSHITNCLLEVPQRIKLELNNGTLTLKAGSVVIVPNGFEEDGTTPKFDYVDIESDLILTRTWGTAEPVYIFFNLEDMGIAMGGTARFSSGTTAPTLTNAQWWYDTNTNLIKRYSSTSDSGSRISFPIAICTKPESVESSVIASINQVFNGMGYIGSTVWVDKGVKGLIPNGRNEDGTLRNIEFVTDKLKTVTNASVLSQPLWYIVTSSSELYNSTTDYWIYDNEENLYKHGNNNGHFVVIAQSNTTNGVISNFQPKQPVRLATTDVVDGQWQKLSTHTTILSVNSYGTYEVDLSAFLPKDGYSYEITLWHRIATQLKVNDIYIWYQTSLMLDTNVYYAHGSGANDNTWYRSASTTTIPIGIDRKLIFKVNTSATPTNINYLVLNLCGYRRLGMN